MQRRATMAFLLGLAFAVGLPLEAEAKRILAVAAAGDLRGALVDVETAFEKRNPGVRVDLSFGASGSLTAQIQQGAPFDVFLSADAAFPEQLRQAGLVSPEGAFPYATGYLVLWVPRELGLNPSRDGLSVLRDPRIKRIAVANPRLAPYGRSAEKALIQAGLQQEVSPRLVFGDNVAQAAQFLLTYAAEAGLISQSQALHPNLGALGITWRLPEALAAPLKQHGVILARSAEPHLARAFRDFLLGAEGQAILSHHGFGKP